MMRATVRVPATSANLGPGFDCLGLALDLHNTITLDVLTRPADPLVIVRGEGYERLPRTGRNLALRAAQRLLRAATPDLFVARLTLDNAIPVSAGLGSSAAAIIGAMLAANALAGSPWRHDELLRAALELEPHPDNLAPALCGGFTVAVLDTSGQPLVAALPPPRGLRAVVLTPELAISTRHSRATLPPQVSHADAAYTVGRAALLVASLLTQRHELLGAAMDDRLHQTYRAAAYPAMPAIIAAAVQAGASGAALSGSGPSILALCAGPTGPVGTAMQEAAAREGLAARVYHLDIAEQGATVLSMAKPH